MDQSEKRADKLRDYYLREVQPRWTDVLAMANAPEGGAPAQRSLFVDSSDQQVPEAEAQIVLSDTPTSTAAIDTHKDEGAILRSAFASSIARTHKGKSVHTLVTAPDSTVDAPLNCRVNATQQQLVEAKLETRYGHLNMISKSPPKLKAYLSEFPIATKREECSIAYTMGAFDLAELARFWAMSETELLRFEVRRVDATDKIASTTTSFELVSVTRHEG